MPRQHIWVSYDLGIKGDYEGIYRWLDGHKAKECGVGLGYFLFDYAENLLDELKRDLYASVEIDSNKDRIYVLRLQDGDIKGRFIVGNRKSPPWAGTAISREQVEDNG